MKGYQDSNSCILSQAGPMDRVLRRGVKGAWINPHYLHHSPYGYCYINVFISSYMIIYVIYPQVKELDMAALRTKEGSKDWEEETVGEKQWEVEIREEHFFFSGHTNIS